MKGFNTYGGGFGTDGKMRVGNRMSIIYALEYSLTQNWVLALDNVYIHTDRNHFSGQKGVNTKGKPATMDLPSSEQFSFCPAIEYNFSESLGWITGAWVAAFGRNSPQFASLVTSLVCSF